MNKINFAERKTIEQSGWSSRMSALLVIAILFLVGFLHVRQRNILMAVKFENQQASKRVAKLHDMLEEKRGLKEQSEQLKNKIKKITKLKNNPQTYFGLFASINEMLNEGGALEALHIAHKKIELTITYPDIKKANQFMKTMTDLPSVSQLKLVSIHPKSEQLQFKIIGKLS